MKQTSEAASWNEIPCVLRKLNLGSKLVLWQNPKPRPNYISKEVCEGWEFIQKKHINRVLWRGPPSWPAALKFLFEFECYIRQGLTPLGTFPLSVWVADKVCCITEFEEPCCILWSCAEAWNEDLIMNVVTKCCFSLNSHSVLRQIFTNSIN